MSLVDLFGKEDPIERGGSRPVPVVRANSPVRVTSGEFRQRMREVGVLLRQSGVAVIYLIEGDSLPLYGGEVVDRAGASLEAVSASGRAHSPKTHPSANCTGYEFSERYASAYNEAINEMGLATIPVRLSAWSGENHHLGRADGAIRLIAELASLEIPRNGRVLLWGHGHAGNVLALATSLLGAEKNTVARFFESTRIYYRWPVLGCVDVPVWEGVRRWLEARPNRPNRVPFDLVTFGTPVRYGWHLSDADRLLHFVSHRRTTWPNGTRHVGGAQFQQFASQGTDEQPGPFAWRARMANRRLGEFLVGNEENLLEGSRQEGTTLWVDYSRSNEEAVLPDHAVYARPEWLPFHAEEVVRRFYPSKSRSAA